MNRKTEFVNELFGFDLRDAFSGDFSISGDIQFDIVLIFNKPFSIYY